MKYYSQLINLSYSKQLGPLCTLRNVPSIHIYDPVKLHVNAIEFELVYLKDSVQHFTEYATVTPSTAV